MAQGRCRREQQQQRQQLLGTETCSSCYVNGEVCMHIT